MTRHFAKVDFSLVVLLAPPASTAARRDRR